MSEFDFDDILNADTPIEEEPLVEDQKPVEKKEFFNIKEKSFDVLKELLSDNDFQDSRYLERNTCACIVDLMEELSVNGGNLAEGNVSRDGFIMYNCPKHVWAPINLCINCRHWKSTKNGKPFGCCVATKDDYNNPEYDELDKYTNKEAKDMEIKFRKERGYFVD